MRNPQAFPWYVPEEADGHSTGFRCRGQPATGGLLRSTIVCPNRWRRGTLRFHPYPGRRNVEARAGADDVLNPTGSHYKRTPFFPGWSDFSDSTEQKSLLYGVFQSEPQPCSPVAVHELQYVRGEPSRTAYRVVWEGGKGKATTQEAKLKQHVQDLFHESSSDSRGQ